MGLVRTRRTAVRRYARHRPVPGQAEYFPRLSASLWAAESRENFLYSVKAACRPPGAAGGAPRRPRPTSRSPRCSGQLRLRRSRAAAPPDGQHGADGKTQGAPLLACQVRLLKCHLRPRKIPRKTITAITAITMPPTITAAGLFVPDGCPGAECKIDIMPVTTTISLLVAGKYQAVETAQPRSRADIGAASNQAPGQPTDGGHPAPGQ
jgi:hypothetical protein